MSKKWILTLVFVLAASLAVGMVPAAAENSPMQWNSNWDWNDNWGCYNDGSCYSNTYCSNNYCGYSNPWYSACNQAEFVQDITIPDGSYVTPGTNFRKTWRLKNVGSCAWNAGYKLVYAGGDQLGGPASVNIPYYVAPGKTVDVSINLYAPNSSGSFNSNWMLMSDSGERFGVGWGGQTPIWVNISTWTSQWQNSCYCVGQYNCNCAPSYCYGSACSPQRSNGNRNPYCNNKIRAINDVTIPDGQVMLSDSIFRKTWTMKNGGTCVWDENYTLVFSGGEQMGGAQYVRIPKKVYPGESIKISIDLKAPSTPGSYKGYYMLQDNLGYTFGYGSYANTPFWVDITVREQPTAAKAVESVAAAPVASESKSAEAESVNVPEVSISAKNEEKPEVVPFNACGAQHIEIVQESSAEYLIKWFVMNDGAGAWDSKKYKLVSTGLSGQLALSGEEIIIPDTEPGSEAEVNFTIKEVENSDVENEPLWMEFNIDDGNEQFCQFYFEIPE